jgi:hypothetical protein
LEAILLLHNAQPDETPFTNMRDHAHLFLDGLVGAVTTNAFEGEDSFGKIGMVLLTGVVFNCESNPNVRRLWDKQLEQQVFNTVCDVMKGEELTIILAGAEELNKHGIQHIGNIRGV